MKDKSIEQLAAEGKLAKGIVHIAKAEKEELELSKADKKLAALFGLSNCWCVGYRLGKICLIDAVHGLLTIRYHSTNELCSLLGVDDYVTRTKIEYAKRTFRRGKYWSKKG